MLALAHLCDQLLVSVAWSVRGEHWYVVSSGWGVVSVVTSRARAVARPRTRTGLVRTQSNTTTRARLALWVAFLLGVAVSLAANIAAAPTLSWQPVLVAGWPPLALLLAVELVVHSRNQDQTSTVQARPETTPAAEPEPETVAIESAETETETGTQTAPGTNRRTSGPAAARRPRRPGTPVRKR